ncbi:hypothetical protein J5I95_08695 [Candidatus Poribacteria bacterium]|jgi:hypothetical protein|nr:hypothetical protein [Candidatus Poribacteria bacterium]
MKNFYQLTIAIAIGFALVIGTTQSVFAQANDIKGGPLKAGDLLKDPNPNGDGLRENQSDNKNWITKWYGPDGNYENNGGFQASAPKDFIDEGSGGKLTQPKLSTVAGLNLTKTVDMEWKGGNGGTRQWTVFELDPANPSNMNRDGPVDNIDTYGMIVIHSPAARKAVMSPAHDDHAQIWINGEKWYNNSRWTGGAQTILHNVEVDLKKGANVLLYRVGESGGDAYINLHFDDKTHKESKIYPDKSKDQKSFFQEVAGVLDVQPAGKLTTIWADIKRNR